jgi:hypothetical protein
MAHVAAVESQKNVRLLGSSNLAGRSDGCQVMVAKNHAFVGHVFSAGVSVVDVRNPRDPRPVNFLPVHPASWSSHCQTSGDYLLVIEEFNFYSVFNTEKAYYASSQGINSRTFGRRGEDYSAGIRVYDISNPATPRAIGFMEVEGLGVHRIWWVGDRYAYASAFLDGYIDHIFIIIDLADITAPKEVGRWWIPGMWAAGGEQPSWRNRVAHHHAVVVDDVAYGAWRDGGLTILGVRDKSDPKLVAHRNWSPPFAGGTHSALPLPDRNLVVVADEAVGDISAEPLKYTWVLDVRSPENPVTIATMPVPADQDYFAKEGHFGPQNLWENRPEGYQSSTTIFATYQNAGLRVFDLTNPFRPEEQGWFVPWVPDGMVDTRPDIAPQLHTMDVYVEKSGLAYLTDLNGGLYAVEIDGL